MPPEHEPMHVLVVAPTPFFADRGCHVRIYEQCRALRRAGNSVVVCTYHLGRDVDDLEVRRSIRIPWYRKLSAGPSMHKFYIDPLLLATVLRAGLRRRPDVIHAHLHEGVAIGYIASRLLGVPLVGDMQGSLTGELVQHRFVSRSGPLHRAFSWAERLITQMPDVVVASSAGTLASLPGRIGASRRAHVLPDGVDTSQFYPDGDGRRAVRERLRLDDDTPVIGYLGVLTEYQGVGTLLQAAQRVLRHARRRPRFLIMGYPDVQRYQRLARELDIAEHTIFTGRIPYDDARAYLSACDVAVSPKRSETEANGKLLNYLAVGLPIVASDTPINREILDDTGIFTPPGDARALAEALLHIVDNRNAARELSLRSLGRAAVHSWDSVGNTLSAIYRQARGLQPAPANPPHNRAMEALQHP